MHICSICQSETGQSLLHIHIHNIILCTDSNKITAAKLFFLKEYNTQKKGGGAFFFKKKGLILNEEKIQDMKFKYKRKEKKRGIIINGSKIGKH